MPSSLREEARQQAGRSECAGKEGHSPSHCESSDSPLREGVEASEDFFQRDADIQKALKTVRKAVFMRLIVMALLIWVVVSARAQLWVVGMIAFVVVINLTGLVPLVQEWHRQKRKLDELWDEA